MREIFKIIAAIALCQSVGVPGLIFVARAIPAWYEGIAKPVFAPPGWMFIPVSIALYALMGIAFYLIWRERTKEQCHCAVFTLFFFQMILYAFWPYLFFGLKEPLLALFGSAMLFATLGIVIWGFWNIRRAAAYILFPYAAWVAFLAYLTYGVWRLS